MGVNGCLIVLRLQPLWGENVHVHVWDKIYCSQNKPQSQYVLDLRPQVTIDTCCGFLSPRWATTSRFSKPHIFSVFVSNTFGYLESPEIWRVPTHNEIWQPGQFFAGFRNYKTCASTSQSDLAPLPLSHAGSLQDTNLQLSVTTNSWRITFAKVYHIFLAIRSEQTVLWLDLGQFLGFCSVLAEHEHLLSSHVTLNPSDMICWYGWVGTVLSNTIFRTIELNGNVYCVEKVYLNNDGLNLLLSWAEIPQTNSLLGEFHADQRNKLNYNQCGFKSDTVVFMN